MNPRLALLALATAAGCTGPDPQGSAAALRRGAASTCGTFTHRGDTADKTNPTPPPFTDYFEGAHVVIRWYDAAHPAEDCELDGETDCYDPSYPGHGDPDVPDLVEDLAAYADNAYERLKWSYDMRPEAEGKILIDFVEPDPEDPHAAYAKPGDLIEIYADWRPSAQHGAQERDVELLMMHEVFHLAQLRHYAPGWWPRNGSGEHDPIFEKFSAQIWLAESAAKHMERRMLDHPGWMSPRRDLLLHSPMATTDPDRKYDGFAMLEYLQGVFPGVDLPAYYFHKTTGWFVPANLPTETTDRILYARVAQLTVGPDDWRALWSRFALGYQYQHSDSLVHEITDWAEGWAPVEAPSVASRMRGSERLTGAVVQRRQEDVVTDDDAVWLENGYMATFAVDVEAALCAPPATASNGLPCTFGGPGGLSAPLRGWDLVLQLDAPAGTYATIYRDSPDPVALPARLFEVIGPVGTDRLVRVPLGALDPRDRIVVTFNDDPMLSAAADAESYVAVAAAFDRSGGRLAVGHIGGVCRIDLARTVSCTGSNLVGQAGTGTVLPDGTVAPPWIAGMNTLPLADVDWITAGNAGGEVCARPVDGDAACWGAGWIAGARTVPTPPTPDWLRDARDIAVGAEHTCAVTAGGEVWCIGYNNAGQIGDGTIYPLGPYLAWVKAAGVANAVEVVVATQQTCAVLEDTSVMCWGLNIGNVLGVGASGPYSPWPRWVIGLGGVRQLAMAGGTQCVRKLDGSAWCWGENQRGQVGDGTFVLRTAPTRVVLDAAGTPLYADEVSAGYQHSCARTPAGTVMCWGDSSGRGLLGNGQVCPGGCPTPYPVQVLEVAQAISLSTSGYTTCAGDVHAVPPGDERLWCWGLWRDGGGAPVPHGTPLRVD